MLIENAFEVPASPEAAWELLLDVPRVVPCMPGATLDEVVDERTWKATVKVKLGPIGMTFASDVVREAVDADERRIVLAVTARETKGRGGARATVTSTVLPHGDGGARVQIVTDLALSGVAGQFGGPVVKAVASGLVKRFAECLAQQLA